MMQKAIQTMELIWSAHKVSKHTVHVFWDTTEAVCAHSTRCPISATQCTLYHKKAVDKGSSDTDIGMVAPCYAGAVRALSSGVGECCLVEKEATKAAPVCPASLTKAQGVINGWVCHM